MTGIFYCIVILATCKAAFVNSTQHSGEKKQFVNYGLEDGGNDFNDENVGGIGGDSESYLNNNGLSEESENYGMLGSRNSLGSMDDNEDGGGQFSEYSSFLNQDSSYNDGQQTGVGLAEGPPDASNNPSLLSGLDDGETTSDSTNDLLSSFADDSLEKKLENNVNLGDTMGTQGTGQSDFSSLESYKGSSGVMDKLLSSGYTLGSSQQSSSHHPAAGSNKHDTGDGREGIGNKLQGMEDLLQGELGQLDSADEKLQKMLESGIDSDSNNFANAQTDTGLTANGDIMGNQGSMGNQVASDNGLMNSLQDQMNQMDNQLSDQSQSSSQSNSYQSDYGQNDVSTQQQGAMNQMSGTMSQNAMDGIQRITVHVHASDKSSKQSAQPANPVVSQNIADHVQQEANKDHKQKLTKLKTRLKALRLKLVQLEEEQAKKSTSNTNEDNPKTSRNNAIKRLLIKNLKLAAMIATKEIQLEEAKGRGLAYLSGKKEDNLKSTDAEDEDSKIKVEKQNDHEFIKSSKPLTELSRKAEEEVNHLTKNMPETEKGIAKSNMNATAFKTATATKTETKENIENKTTTITSQTEKVDNITKNNNINNDTTISSSDNTTKDHNLSFLGKINETLQILDKSGTVNAMKDNSSVLENSSKNFLKTLKSKINSLPATKAHSVEEKALATLYKAITVKAAENAKKRHLLLRNNYRLPKIQEMTRNKTIDS